MKVIYVDTSSDEKISLAVQEAVDFLNSGKIIVYPTDTIYGLGCDALNEEAVCRLARIKKRAKNKPFSLMVKDIETIGTYSFLSVKNRKIAEKILPGPFTLILPGAKNIPPCVLGGKNSAGFRMPNNKICQLLSARFVNPIVTTSVNLSGEESLNDPFKIYNYFRDKELAPDLLIDVGKIENSQASIIIDLTRSNPQIMRTGTRSLAEIKKLLSDLTGF